MQTMADTTFHTTVAVIAARWDVFLCYWTTPDTYFQAANNLIKTSLTCAFWQVQIETRMSVNTVFN